MLTVLLVIIALFVFCQLFALVDGHRVTSSEVGSYLHYEYHMADSFRRPTVAQIRNL